MRLFKPNHLNQAAGRSFSQFCTQYPTWAESLLDWHFVQTHILPNLCDSLNHHPLQTEWLAELWALSAGLSEKTKARWQPRAQKAIEVYLDKLQLELPSAVLRASLSR